MEWNGDLAGYEAIPYLITKMTLPIMVTDLKLSQIKFINNKLSPSSEK